MLIGFLYGKHVEILVLFLTVAAFLLQSLDNPPAVEVPVARGELSEMFADCLHRLESPGGREVVLVPVGVPGVVILRLQLPPEHVHGHSEVQS